MCYKYSPVEGVALQNNRHPLAKAKYSNQCVYYAYLFCHWARVSHFTSFPFNLCCSLSLNLKIATRGLHHRQQELLVPTPCSNNCIFFKKRKKNSSGVPVENKHAEKFFWKGGCVLLLLQRCHPSVVVIQGRETSKISLILTLRHLGAACDD